MERRRADTVKELKLTARISPNDMRVKAAKAQKFLANGHKVTLRVEFKTNDGVKPSLRPKAGALLFREFQTCLIETFETPHVVLQEGKMVGPNHMTVTLAPEREKGKGKKGKTERPSRANVSSSSETLSEIRRRTRPVRKRLRRSGGGGGAGRRRARAEGAPRRGG